MRLCLPLFCLCAAMALLSGCAAPPDAGRAITAAEKAADYPLLAPIDSLLIGDDPQIKPETEADLLARAAALRARAARLRRGAISAPERARMSAGPDL